MSNYAEVLLSSRKFVLDIIEGHTGLTADKILHDTTRLEDLRDNALRHLPQDVLPDIIMLFSYICASKSGTPQDTIGVLKHVRNILEYPWLEDSGSLLALSNIEWCAVTDYTNFVKHFDAVIAEYKRSGRDYLLTKRTGDFTCVHFTHPDNVESIRLYGIRPGRSFTSFGPGVYAYDIRTPADDITFGIDYVPIYFKCQTVYQCVASNDTTSPMREIFIPNLITPAMLIDEPSPVPKLSTEEFLLDMGYPETMVQMLELGQTTSIKTDCDKILNYIWQG